MELKGASITDSGMVALNDVEQSDIARVERMGDMLAGNTYYYYFTTHTHTHTHRHTDTTPPHISPHSPRTQPPAPAA